MSMRSLDETPVASETKWYENFPRFRIDQKDQYYQIRLVGGVFNSGQHWIKFTNAQGVQKQFPTDCYNWNHDKVCAGEGCPVCADGNQSRARYWMNCINRTLQQRGQSNPIEVIDMPTTVFDTIRGYRQLNKGPDGVMYAASHADMGFDIFLRKTNSQKSGGWEVTKGNTSPLTQEERAYQLFEIDKFYMNPDPVRLKADLDRAKNKAAGGPPGFGGPQGGPPGFGGPQGGPPGFGGPQGGPPGFGGPGDQLSGGSMVQVPVQLAVQPAAAPQPMQPAAAPQPMQPAAAPQPMQPVSGPPQISVPATSAEPTPSTTATPTGGQPSCYGAFKGEMECLRCSFRPDCVSLSRQASASA